eukprot:3932646-Rhodomonas_salina.1
MLQEALQAPLSPRTSHLASQSVCMRCPCFDTHRLHESSKVSHNTSDALPPGGSPSACAYKTAQPALYPQTAPVEGERVLLGAKALARRRPQQCEKWQHRTLVVPHTHVSTRLLAAERLASNHG